ncbi:MAG: type II toxin-antitoxin system RelE/ParE family toxin [Pseudomonadota bacterium]
MPIIPRRILFKLVIWQGRSREDLQAFPADAMHEAGHELLRVQRGFDPTNWKPMTDIGPGVREIRIRKSGKAFRVVYFATRPEGIYVLHCFQKTSQKTGRQDIDIAGARFRDIPVRKGIHEGT